MAPSILSLSLANTKLSEGGTTSLAGTLTGPGTLDTHSVDINWGDGSADTQISLWLRAS